MFILFIGSSRNPKLGTIIGIVGGSIILVCGMLIFLYKRRCKGYRQEVFVDVAGLYHVADECF